jgi:hypothetical protein
LLDGQQPEDLARLPRGREALQINAARKPQTKEKASPAASPGGVAIAF